MQQSEPKVTAELSKNELDSILQQRAKRRETETTREAFKAMSVSEQRAVLRQKGVKL
ncbi:hypothetical protein [Acidithiobacillus sp.]|uniref:hypothetical protein n=1 Tax=Acidithiobacillus sp. TaxID=1872118 RepID=UPI00260DC381|nr:hypothetical protein [Acidithiobacillus sp.]MDD2748592.1 hypothetical protein [Acidithiobacillus sp.]MDD5279877.1 hypothetical protein [Acidithiobacillus sp.]